MPNGWSQCVVAFQVAMLSSALAVESADSLDDAILPLI